MPTWAVSELRRLRPLEEDNSRLKRLVADRSLDTHRLAEALRKTVEGPHAVENLAAWFHGTFQVSCLGPVVWLRPVGPLGIDGVKPWSKRPCGSGFAIWSMGSRQPFRLPTGLSRQVLCISDQSCRGLVGGEIKYTQQIEVEFVKPTRSL